VKTIAKDTTTLQQMGQNALALSSDVFSPATVYGYWIRVLERLLDPAAARKRMENSPFRRRSRLNVEGSPVSEYADQHPLDRLFDLLLEPRESADGMGQSGHGLTGADWRIRGVFPGGKKKLGLWDLQEAESSR
jgi:hypothetical protein